MLFLSKCFICSIILIEVQVYAAQSFATTHAATDYTISSENAKSHSAH